MDNMFICIDTTVNKSAIHQFKNFLQKYPEVTKWFMCSDYCIADTKKPNDVVSFVLYPYILDFNEWNEGKRQILMRSDTKLPQPFASWSNSL